MEQCILVSTITIAGIAMLILACWPVVEDPPATYDRRYVKRHCTRCSMYGMPVSERQICLSCYDGHAARQ